MKFLNLQEVYSFIEAHINDNISALILSHSKRGGNDISQEFPLEFAIVQIESRRKSIKKLAGFLRNREFLFPSVQCAEQSTNEFVAQYHALLAGTGKRIVDLTAGLGIDAFTMAVKGNCVTAVELDPARAEILRHNKEVLNIRDIDIINSDCIEWMKNLTLERDKTGRKPFDIAFIDPARRDDNNRRTYFFKDTLPDITVNYDLVRKTAATLMVKASPILDITSVTDTFPDIREIHIVCVKGECKEVLAIMEDGCNTKDSEIIVTDLSGKDAIAGNIEIRSEFRVKSASMNQSPEQFIMPREGEYLYEPNAGLQKLRVDSEICKRFEVGKVARDTNLFHSESLHPDFPGRIFKINRILDKKQLKALKGEARDVAVRNYPLDAEQLRARLKVKPNETHYIYGMRAGVGAIPMLLDCDKLH
ncbi:MAG: class I SAM-dependent methyltransferase [Candidatus Amulumruptor caecigallinarius]|nr:class I SAM-dependent methyltransferase [Candidatus Amulumruptor caecigallinarius]